EAHVWLIDPLAPDRLVIRHLDERRGQLNPGSCKRRRQKPFNHTKHRLLPRKGHLQVDLAELRLTIRAQVFVAEASSDLEVAIEAGDHQNLLENLRRLGQRIEATRM